MRVAARWGLTITASAGSFALAWWACQKQAGLDEGAPLEVAGAPLEVTGWWAGRDRLGGGPAGGGGREVRQRSCAGRDAYTARRDQTVINVRRPEE